MSDTTTYAQGVLVYYCHLMYDQIQRLAIGGKKQANKDTHWFQLGTCQLLKRLRGY